MSTVTKLKGSINNKDLPILTENGLVSGAIDIYKYRLSRCGYELTQEEESAIQALYTSLESSELLEKIGSMYPLLGSSSIPASINVPFLGYKILEIDDNFSGIKYTTSNNVQGVTHFPAQTGVTLADLTDLKDGIGVGISHVGTTTFPEEETGEVALTSRNILTFRASDQSQVQVRLWAYTDTDTTSDGKSILTPENRTGGLLGIYPFNSGAIQASQLIGMVPNSQTEPFISMAGYNQNRYSVIGWGTPGSQIRYSKGYVIDDQSFAVLGGTDGSGNYSISGLGSNPNNLVWAAPSLVTDTFVITTITFFNSLPTTEQITSFTDALKTFCAATSKDITPDVGEGGGTLKPRPNWDDFDSGEW